MGCVEREAWREKKGIPFRLTSQTQPGDAMSREDPSSDTPPAKPDDEKVEEANEGEHTLHDDETRVVRSRTGDWYEAPLEHHADGFHH